MALQISPTYFNTVNDLFNKSPQNLIFLEYITNYYKELLK